MTCEEDSGCFKIGNWKGEVVVIHLVGCHVHRYITQPGCFDLLRDCLSE